MTLTLSQAIESSRRALATFAGAVFYPFKREPLRQQARRLLALLEANASENQYRGLLLEYRDELVAALQRCERAVEAARRTKAERHQLGELIAKARQNFQGYIPERQSVVRQADDVVDILRRSGDEEAVRLAEEIARLRDRIEAREIARLQAWRAWRRGNR